MSREGPLNHSLADLETAGRPDAVFSYFRASAHTCSG